VASEQGDSEERPETSHEPRECMACRGTGRVISNLGGAPSEVACPWCEGTGTRVPGIDAQVRWREQSDATADAGADGAAGGADAERAGS
jgi:DnaJ-class molecular chaperone